MFGQQTNISTMSDDVTHIGVLFNEAFEAILSKALAEEQNKIYKQCLI